MTDPDLTLESETESPVQRSRRYRIGRWIVIRFFWVLVIVLMIALLQRKLIYRPLKSDPLTIAEADQPAGQIHAVTVTSDDNLTLHGWHYLPANQPANTEEELATHLASTPLVVLYFSGNAGNRRNRVADCNLFTRLGADVFIFDHRGYGENPGKPSEKHLFADAHVMWKYLTETRKIPADRIVLYGESLGGGIATRLASDLCEAGTPPAGLLLRATFSSLTDAARHHYPFLPVRLMLVDRFESDVAIKTVTCPILHLHGNKDKVVPMKSGQTLIDAAPDEGTNGMKKRFVELPDTGHNDILTVAFPQFRQEIHDFFKEIIRRRDEH